MASEKKLESDFGKRIKAMGGESIKFTSPTHSGVPDRLVMVPLGVTCFVEFKSTGEKLEPLQAWWQRRLKVLEVKHFVVDEPEMIDVVIDWLKAEQDKIFKTTLIPRPVPIEPACCPKCGDRLATEVNGFKDAETTFCINTDCNYQHTKVYQQ